MKQESSNYKSETVMANLLREKTTQPDIVRSLLRKLYSSEADLIHGYEKGTLTVQLHHQANRSFDEAIHPLSDELNATETQFP